MMNHVKDMKITMATANKIEDLWQGGNHIRESGSDTWALNQVVMTSNHMKMEDENVIRTKTHMWFRALGTAEDKVMHQCTGEDNIEV